MGVQLEVTLRFKLGFLMVNRKIYKATALLLVTVLLGFGIVTTARADCKAARCLQLGTRQTEFKPLSDKRSNSDVCVYCLNAYTCKLDMYSSMVSQRNFVSQDVSKFKPVSFTIASASTRTSPAQSTQARKSELLSYPGSQDRLYLSNLSLIC